MSPLHYKQRRYDKDPVYRVYVDHMIAAIERLDISPSELREMAMFACYLVELRRPSYRWPLDTLCENSGKELSPELLAYIEATK